MDLKTVESQIGDAANDIGAEIKDDAKSIFARVTSAISSFLGFANPKWKQFVADWRVWTWAKRVAFLLIAGLFVLAGIRWGTGALRLIGGNYDAARAYSSGDIVTKADVDKVRADGERKLNQVRTDLKSNVDALKQKVDALGDRLDGLGDSISQVQAELSALEDARQPQKAEKITTGSVVHKSTTRTKTKVQPQTTLWDQMKAVMP